MRFQIFNEFTKYDLTISGIAVHWVTVPLLDNVLPFVVSSRVCDQHICLELCHIMDRVRRWSSCLSFGHQNWSIRTFWHGFSWCIAQAFKWCCVYSICLCYGSSAVLWCEIPPPLLKNGDKVGCGSSMLSILSQHLPTPVLIHVLGYGSI